MNTDEDYEFWIEAYTPKTIPMKRLGEYMAQLGRLLGHESSVHFHELREGSTTVGVKIEREAVPKVQQRILSIKRAEATNDATTAQAQINEMLRSDNAVAEFRRCQPEGETEPMLRLAGREIPKPQRIGPFSEAAAFKGELVRIEGADVTKHAGIMDAQGRLWSGEMSRELAIQMRSLLFEWVIVEGMARWLRNEQGEWELKGFQIQSCKALPKDTLADDVQALRNVAGNQWKDTPDPLGFIRESRGDEDEIH